LNTNFINTIILLLKYDLALDGVLDVNNKLISAINNVALIKPNTISLVMAGYLISFALTHYASTTMLRPFTCNAKEQIICLAAPM